MKAYILRSIDYGDHGKILHAYTGKGLQGMIARGVKKMESPLRHMCQPSMLIDGDLSKGKLPTLKDARLIDHFPAVKKDFRKQTVLQCVNELIYRNIGEDDHEKLFGFLLRFIKKLEATATPEELLMVFELKFLWFLGIGVHFKDCHVCHAREELVYDARQGALVCPEHRPAENTVYGKEIPALLQYYYYVALQDFQAQGCPPATLKLLYALIDDLYATHLGFKGKAKNILESLL